MAKRKLSPLQQKYQNFFFGMLEEFGVSSPAKLSKDKKSEFFNRIKKEWPKAKRLKESAEDKLRKVIKEEIISVLLETDDSRIKAIEKELEEFDKLNARLAGRGKTIPTSSINKMNKLAKELKALKNESIDFSPKVNREKESITFVNDAEVKQAKTRLANKKINAKVTGKTLKFVNTAEFKKAKSMLGL